MNVEEAALVCLIRLARQDGVSNPERELLDRHAHELNVPAQRVRELLQTTGTEGVCPSAFEAPERAPAVIETMVEFAHVDGVSWRERKWIRKVAGKLGVGPLEFLGILRRVKKRLHVWRPLLLRLSAVVTGAVLVVAALILMNESAPSADDVLAANEKRFRPATVLIATRYVMERFDEDVQPPKKERKWHIGYGTGFFVSSSGYIATNKHVLRDWLFNPIIIERLKQGWTVDTSTVTTAAWPHGAVLRDNGKTDWSSAWNEADNTLSVHQMGDDEFETVTRRLRTGQVFKGKFHVVDYRDLAVLKARVAEPQCCIPLQLDLDEVHNLQHVMLLGYPANITGDRADPAVTTGKVSKVERPSRIHCTASTLGGNSGGPLISLDGQVIGVVNVTFGAATASGAIPAHYLLDLLPDGGVFLAATELAIAAGALDFARIDLQLARARGVADAHRARLEALERELGIEPR